jgi:hypothetical protein
VLGILDDDGRAIQSAGILAVPDAVKLIEHETAPVKGKVCPSCHAAAMIKRDGCEFCTACGYTGHCFGTAGEVLSLTSSFFAPQQPDSSFANINYYGFQLQFVEAGARMYHSLDLAFWSDSKLVTVDPNHCYKWIPGFVCGYSGTYSDGSPTAPAVFVEFKVVPEPSSIWLLLAAGAAGWMLLRRRPARRLPAAA